MKYNFYLTIFRYWQLLMSGYLTCTYLGAAPAAMLLCDAAVTVNYLADLTLCNYQFP